MFFALASLVLGLHRGFLSHTKFTKFTKSRIVNSRVSALPNVHIPEEAQAQRVRFCEFCVFCVSIKNT